MSNHMQKETMALLKRLEFWMDQRSPREQEELHTALMAAISEWEVNQAQEAPDVWSAVAQRWRALADGGRKQPIEHE